MLNNLSSRDLLEQVGAASSAPMLVKDLEHRYIYANEAYIQAVGISMDELIGKNDLELGRPESLVLGDSATGWVGLWELDNQAIRAGASTTHAGAGLNSRTSIVTKRTPLFDDDGNAIGLFIVLQDLEEVHGLDRRVENNREAHWIEKGEVTTLDEVVVSLSACPDTETLLHELAKTIVERTRADGAYIARVHELGEYLEFVAAAGAECERFIGARRGPNEGLIGEIWQRGEAAFVNDVSDNYSLYKWPHQTQAFGIPIFVDGSIVAVLSTVSLVGSSDLALDIPLLKRISRVACFGIANTLLMDATAKALTKTQAAEELSRILSTVESATDACNEVCRTLLPAFDTTRASAHLIDENGTIQNLVSWTCKDGEVRQADTLPTDLIRDSIVQWCVDNAQMAVIERGVIDDRESSAMHAMRKKLGIGSTCCVPLKTGNSISGAFVISRDHDQVGFSDKDADAFTSAVNQLSGALERHELAAEIKHQAFHDKLTTLPNRHHFELELEQAIVQAAPGDDIVTVLFLDLDGFKDVNDSLGHAAGDSLLSLVSERLGSCIKHSDVLARMGGDEFAVIVRNESTVDVALSIARRMLSALSAPFNVANETVQVGASIGVSEFPKDGANGDDILRCADTAMYQAKHSGKGQVLCFDKTLAEDARDRNKMEAELRQAIQYKEFRLLYQPQVRCTDSQVVGVEALIRWDHPKRGIVSPLEFIPLAESVGLINVIGAWVIDEAVRQLEIWQKTSLKDMRVSVNIAASQFQLEDFTDQVLDALKRYNVPPSLLELEVTESVVMNDVASVAKRLRRLRDAGVRVSIDDFGTGYSSLSYLQDLPLDALKIDRSFVNRLADKHEGQSLVKTIQVLASGLGLETVAEGVESLEQKDAVVELGCDLIQGYLHSRPVAADQIAQTVEEIQSGQGKGTDLTKAA